MNNKINIVLTGVGGQGVITAAYILGKAAVKGSVNVYSSQVHGMAQRGGSVLCTVRMGKVLGPLIPRGTADVILSTEPIEALRYIKYANKKTMVITDVQQIVPFTVTIGLEKYPDVKDVFEEIRKYAKLYTIDAARIAKNAGASDYKNIVLLGALAASNVIPFSSNILLETILDTLPKRYKEINKKLFNNIDQSKLKRREFR